MWAPLGKRREATTTVGGRTKKALGPVHAVLAELMTMVTDFQHSTKVGLELL